MRNIIFGRNKFHAAVMAMMAHITYHAVIFHENPPDTLPP